MYLSKNLVLIAEQCPKTLVENLLRDRLYGIAVAYVFCGMFFEINFVGFTAILV